MLELLMDALKKARCEVGMSHFTLIYSTPNSKWKLTVNNKVFMDEDIKEVVANAVNYINENKINIPNNKYTLLKSHVRIKNV